MLSSSGNVPPKYNKLMNSVFWELPPSLVFQRVLWVRLCLVLFHRSRLVLATSPLRRLTLLSYFRSLKNNVQIHHCYGRGGKHHQRIHSSVLNSVPLCHECHFDFHHCKEKDERRVNHFRITSQRVQKAIDEGRYSLKKKDKEFLRHYQLAEIEQNGAPSDS